MRYAEPEVRAGIALLDERRGSGWMEDVDWHILDMSHSDNCVLGQLYGWYDRGKEELGLTSEDASAYGFYRHSDWDDVPEHELAGLAEDDADDSLARQMSHYRYKVLTQTWKEIAAEMGYA